MDLSLLRQKIDSLDATLVSLLNERARVSLDVGALKKAAEAEKAVVSGSLDSLYCLIPIGIVQLKRLNKGPLNQDSLQAIFREVNTHRNARVPLLIPATTSLFWFHRFYFPLPRKIMSASISLQKDVTIAYLGPPGTFTHQCAFERFGDSVAYVPQERIEDIFDAVERGRTTYGIVPFENSTHGSVIQTLDRFIDTEVRIRAEAYLTVHQSLMSNSPLSAVKKIYSHPQALGQCKEYLEKHLPAAERIPVASTAAAAEIVARETGTAAICSLVCAELYGLNVLQEDIEDLKTNTTRFVILATSCDRSTTDDKTLIRFTVDHRQPGALCDGLKVFKDHSINLTRIDSRPSRQRPWHYVFFVECQGHATDETVAAAVKEMEQYCLDVRVLGSYPNQRMDKD
ncbi:Prephenate dehydratase-domain-containing protein [Endogone sp. FLAS-F59071]|nr:Prephenate dehydratase-domain-containing protein [Endogone sp. FLAS-F59071]|eukprot:RUS14778.1 Prephenate dehydratase-domain-containing protein [Endogone sp. FLAS-F59071]